MCNHDNLSPVFENTSAIDSPLPTPSAKVKREGKRAIKLHISTSKALRRQSLVGTTPGIVHRIFLENIDEVLHGPCKITASMKPEEAGQVVYESVKLYHSLNKQLEKIRKSKRRPTEKNGDTLLLDRLQLPYTLDVLEKLGVSPVLPENDKLRRALVERLVSDIFADLELVANEARETLRRRAGYWRFANTKIYDAMVLSNKQIIWGTGEKLNVEAA